MYAGASLPLNSGKKSKCMQKQVYLWTAEIKVNVCRSKFTLEQRKEKKIYAGTSLPLNSGGKSKCMQKQVYI